MSENNEHKHCGRGLPYSPQTQENMISYVKQNEKTKLIADILNECQLYLLCTELGHGL